MQPSLLVVGAGALGSHTVQFLRNLDAVIRVVDFDRVEQRNVASQFHGRGAVGRSKVVSLQQTVQLLFGLKLEAIPHKVGIDNVDALVGKADLVLDCLDNGESRRVVQNAARQTGVPCLHGALAPDGAFGRVVWDHQFVVDDEPAEGAATCHGGEHLPFVATVAGFLAQAAQQYLKSGTMSGFHIHPGGAIHL